MIYKLKDLTFYIFGDCKINKYCDRFLSLIDRLLCKLLYCELQIIGVCENAKGDKFAIKYCKRHGKCLYEPLEEVVKETKCKTCGK